jgi:hypothetical protein
MAAFAPFAPAVLPGASVGAGIAVTVGSGAPAAVAGTLTTTGYYTTIMFTNPGTLVAFCAVSTHSNYSATTGDLPVLSQQRVLSACPGAAGQTLYVSAIAAATVGTAFSVYFTPGEGGGGQS